MIRAWPPRTDAAYAAEALQHLGPRLRDRFARVRLLVFDCDGVLTDGRLYYDAHGEALKAFSARDGFGLALARAAGLQLALLPGRNSAAAARRAADLGFAAVRLGRFDKAAGLVEIMGELGADREETLYMGDDLVDIPALDRCGVPVTVPEAPADVQQRCCYIARRPAGNGAVREVAELVLASRRLLGQALRRLTEEPVGPRPGETP